MNGPRAGRGARPALRSEGFLDRAEAGRVLAREVASLDLDRPIVLGVPRGGVPVAAAVAQALGAPLDLVIVRKLGAPENPELAIGAVAEDGTVVLDRLLSAEVGVGRAEFERILGAEVAELRRRVERYRGGRPAPDVEGRTVVVVDDGFATGLSDLAAVRSVRARGAAEVVVAAPVGSHQAVAMLGEDADRVVCPVVPEALYGVGAWYRDFRQTTDQEVLDLLAAHRDAPPDEASAPRTRPASGEEG